VTRRDPIAIIGGGFAGTSLLRHLIDHTDHEVVLIDPLERPGAGPAYRTTDERHLLNSRASAMSVDACDPGHFVSWLGARGGYSGDFAPRKWYGEYLCEALEQTLDRADERVRVRTASVTDVVPGAEAVRVSLDDGSSVIASHAVLTLGNSASAGPTGPDHDRYVRDPWRSGVLDGLTTPGRVLLIGTGLTAVDVAISLADRAETVTAVSGHGLLPLRHSATVGVPTTKLPPVPTTLRAAVRAVREWTAAPHDWREVMDVLRHHANDAWASWSDQDRQSFIEHYARWWEVHRHRMAPRVADTIAALRADGRLSVRADRVRAVTENGPALTVDFASGASVDADTVVNCTGPSRLPRGANPLVRRLLADGRVRVDSHGLGLDVAPCAGAVDATGRRHERLSVLGALRRGALWETTAVPEIRAQAYDLASRFAT